MGFGMFFLVFWTCLTRKGYAKGSPRAKPTTTKPKAQKPKILGLLAKVLFFVCCSGFKGFDLVGIGFSNGRFGC